MKRRIYSFDEFSDSSFSLSAYFSDKRSSDPKRQRMKKLLNIAVKNELTERQRKCITMYYKNNMKVAEIAKMLSITPSTVYKHISAGIKALKKVVLYL